MHSSPHEVTFWGNSKSLRLFFYLVESWFIRASQGARTVRTVRGQNYIFFSLGSECSTKRKLTLTQRDIKHGKSDGETTACCVQGTSGSSVWSNREETEDRRVHGKRGRSKVEGRAAGHGNSTGRDFHSYHGNPRTTPVSLLSLKATVRFFSAAGKLLKIVGREKKVEAVERSKVAFNAFFSDNISWKAFFVLWRDTRTFHKKLKSNTYLHTHTHFLRPLTSGNINRRHDGCVDGRPLKVTWPYKERAPPTRSRNSTSFRNLVVYLPKGT